MKLHALQMFLSSFTRGEVDFPELLFVALAAALIMATAWVMYPAWRKGR